MDKRALKILLETFWSPAGWKPESQQFVSNEDFLYAKTQGLMFDRVELTHSEAVTRLLKVMKGISKRQVADAFLASLSTRRLDWRSPLGSYAVFQHLTEHPPRDLEHRCSVCGFYLNCTEYDFNVLNFERLKWGGVRHDQVTYALLDLEQFVKAETPRPTPQDVATFRELIDAISSVHDDVTSAQLQAHIAPIIKSNKAERDVLVGILGFSGILGVPEHPGYSDAFIVCNKRALPGRRFVDMSYPACWWSGREGVNRTKLLEYFGHVLRDEA